MRINDTVCIVQTEDAVEIRADVPGVQKDDINVRFLQRLMLSFFLE